MPMNSATLKADLKAEIVAKVSAVFDISDASQLSNFADALAGAIATKVVDHIKTNALVSGNVISGAGAGGTVTGTLS